MVGPVYNYFTRWNWNEWDLVRFQTPADDNCLFHAICNSFFQPYHQQLLKGKAISRYDIVMALRRDLAEKLETIDSNTGKSYYEGINNGNTSMFSSSVPEFSLATMKSMLQSRVPLGYGYMEFIGNCLNKDIYLIDGEKNDIYVTDELPLTIKGNRKSIILYYSAGHYELVGIDQQSINKDRPFQTHFDPQHLLIRALYARVCEILHTADTIGT